MKNKYKYLIISIAIVMMISIPVSKVVLDLSLIHIFGVYKNNDGKEFIVSTKCPHLGCQLGWNADELTWDCPCHGSRFDYKGRLIGSPATKDLIDN